MPFKSNRQPNLSIGASGRSSISRAELIFKNVRGWAKVLPMNKLLALSFALLSLSLYGQANSDKEVLDANRRMLESPVFKGLVVAVVCAIIYIRSKRIK
jgi:hypothetical protein